MDWGNCLVEGIATISCVFPLFQNILNAALGLAGAVALVFIIWSGFKLLTSAGDAKKVGSARQTLFYAIIGLSLVFLSFFIVSLVSNLTGVDCIENFSFTSCE